MKGKLDKFLSIKEVSNCVGISKSQIYKLVALELFPKQVLVSKRSVRWSEEDIDSWMETKKMECRI